MDRPTKAVIGAVLTVCLICIVVGVYDFRWHGIDASVVNDRNYPSAVAPGIAVAVVVAAMAGIAFALFYDAAAKVR